MHVTVRTPGILLLPVWPLPRSLATTGGISVDFFSSPYLDVSVQAVSFIRLFDSPYDDRAYPAGFPHSEIHGSMSAFDSPWHIADCCVLRRLLVPRHSPCALCSLTIFNHLVLLQLNTRRYINCSFTQINLPSCCFTFFYSVFKVHSFEIRFDLPPLSESGGLKWTRTTDLTLIRRAL